MQIRVDRRFGMEERMPDLGIRSSLHDSCLGFSFSWLNFLLICAHRNVMSTWCGLGCVHQPFLIQLKANWLLKMSFGSFAKEVRM